MTYNNEGGTNTQDCVNCGTDGDNKPKFFLGCCIKLNNETKNDLKHLCETEGVQISWNSTCSGRTTLCVDHLGISGLKNLLTQDWARECFNVGN